MDIIDTHFHVWDNTLLPMEWLNAFNGRLKARYTLNDYQRATQGLGIQQSCYVEVDTLASHHDIEAKMIINWCKAPENRLLAATLGANLSLEGFTHYIQKYLDYDCIQGVRHNFFVQDPTATKQHAFIQNTRLLSELKLYCELILPTQYIQYGIELIKACPDTLFIIDHCGAPTLNGEDKYLQLWHEGISAYAERKNTLCKISEFGFNTPNYAWSCEDVKSIIQHCVSSFGQHRVFYGSNWPVCELTAPVAQWIEAIQLSLATHRESTLEQLFYSNAKHYYNPSQYSIE